MTDSDRSGDARSTGNTDVSDEVAGPASDETTTGLDPAPVPDEPKGSPWGSYDGWATSLRRSRSDRIIGGVAAGLAKSIGVPTLIVRLGFVLAGLVFIGIPIYIMAWLMIPDEGTETPVATPGRVLIACALGLVGLLMLNGVMGGTLISQAIIPLGLILVGVALIVRRPVDVPNTPSLDTVPQDSPGPGTVATGTQPFTGEHARVPTSGPAPSPAPKARFKPAFPVVGLLTWSLMFVVTGLLAVLDLTGVAKVGPGVVASAALLVFSAGLLFSAFKGRARGLILPVLALTTVLGVLGALDIRTNSLDPTFDLTVAAESDLPSELQASVGASTLDLSSVALTTNHTVRITQTAGRVRIVLPPDVKVRVKAKVGLGNIDLMRPSRQSAVSSDEELRKKWASNGVPIEGSPVDRSILNALDTPMSWYLQSVSSKSAEGAGQSVGYTLERTASHELTLDVSMGAGRIEFIDPYWASDGWKPVVPTQLCTVGGGPSGVVKSCDDVEITKRVALCINDNGYLVDCREDRPATVDNPRVPACRDFFGDYIDCESVGIDPVNAQLVSPTESSVEGEAPPPTIAMPDASSPETSSGAAPTTQSTIPETTIPVATGD